MKRFYVFLLFVVALTYQTSFYIQANENNLIGTLSILKPEFYPTSPLHGAVAWQQEWVMRLYDLGWDRDKSTGKLIIEDEQPPALIKIIDRLFHRPPETTGMMDFGPVKDIRDQAAADVAQTLGEIIAVLPELISKEVGSKFNRLKELAEQLKASSKTEKIKSTASSLCDVSDADFFGKLAESKKALQNAKIPQKAIFAVEFKKLINEFCEFKENCAKLVRGADTAQLLRQAFSQNPQETLLTLLALLWASSESNREVLAKYYQSLDKKTQALRNTSIFTKDQAPDWNNWIAQKFDPNAEDKMKADVQAFEGNVEENPQIYEALVYLLLMPGDFPKLSGYKEPTLWFDGKSYPAKFADCMDSSMMNFMLILAYKKETKEFNVNFLKQRLEIQTLNEKLERFLNSDHPAFIRKIEGKEDRKINLAPQTIEAIEIHNAWADVESNIPGVAYNKYLKDGNIAKCRGKSKGFIVAAMQPEESSIFQKAGYVIVQPSECICFELQPSLKNFIVLLNYLLNLGLFDSVKVYDEILKPDFIKTYLPKLAEKLKIEMEPSVSPDKIDEKDYGDQILTQLGFDDEFPFDLSTNHGHGEIIKKYSIFAKELKKTFARLPMASNLLPSIHGIKLANLTKHKIRHGSFIADKVLNFYDLPWFDLNTLDNDNPDILQGIKKAHAKNSPRVPEYFINFAEIQPDPVLKFKIFYDITKMVKKLSEKGVAKMLAAASQHVCDDDGDIRYFAGYIFKTLFTKERGYSEALAAASKGLNNADDSVRWAAIDLFKTLVEKDQGYPEATVAASKGVDDADGSVRRIALELFKALVEKGQGFPEATSAASKCTQDIDVYVQIAAINLFKALVEKGQAYPEAKVVVSKCSVLAVASKGDGADGLEAMLGLFETLFEKEQGYSEAKAVIFKCVQNVDGITQAFGLMLSQQLLQKEVISESEMSAILERLQNKNVARLFFNNYIKSILKETTIKEDLELYFSQQ